MLDPALVLFAIQAGVKLGRKTYDVLVDGTREAPLVLPLGSLAGSIREADAVLFFDRPENQALVAPGGPYAGFTGERLVTAYNTVRHVDDKLGPVGGSMDEAVGTIRRLHQFEQHRSGFGPRSPWQRIAGTVVEIGIEYFAANPQAMGTDSAARRVVDAFLVGIRDVPFAEGDPVDVVGDTLRAGLRVLGDDASPLSSDPRIHVVLGGVTASLKADLGATRSFGQLQARTDLIRRILGSVLRGGAAAVATHPDLFVRGEGRARDLVRSTVTALLEGLEGRESLFSNESLEDLTRVLLRTVAANAVLASNDKLVRGLVGQTVAALTDANGSRLFLGGAVAAVLRVALEMVGDNAATLVDGADPERSPLAVAVTAMAHGLGPVKTVFSAGQLVELTTGVFAAVARHPERLLGSADGDPRRTVLAQVLGAVASGLGPAPARLVDGATLVSLVRTALAVTLRNRDKLLDPHSADPRTHLLHVTVAGLAGAALGGSDSRGLFDRDVFLAAAEAVLPVASGNVGPLLGGRTAVIGDAVSAALRLSTGELANRVNGDNLPTLIAGLLGAALDGELRLDDPAATTAAARGLLRATGKEGGR